MVFSTHDYKFMHRALALARRGLGWTSPNPAVGAVLVRGRRVIGEGWHKHTGGPHAEIEAIAHARRQRHNVDGATLYVTLEPCSTWGRTPPCTEAIVTAGIKRVAVAAVDPNPSHQGRGLRLLRRAGIQVERGLLATEATELNAAFNKWITTRLPLVTAKAALSLDGKMATVTGDSKWITSEAARREAHKLRANVDAILVGANTVRHDDPQLTLRHGIHGRQPWRVVVDGMGRCPRHARVFTDAHRRRTIVLTTRRSSAAWRRYLALLGIIVFTFPDKRGGLDLRAVLRELGQMEITSVLVEGGAQLLGAMFDAELVDRVAFFYAPKVIAGAARVAEAKPVHGTWRRVGTEILFEGALR
jgi:diaminohydroxyphosphoribosylaminopyrimidine deaminase / 5-amino-6-(5-phosphoribosylamino)uracil reductase